MRTNSTSPRISLRDIAKRLGVSHVTVSLALRDNPRISLTMREKVKAVAEEMSYRPDPMLAALAHYRKDKKETPVTASLAWINAWPEAEILRHHREFDLYWEGAEQAAQKAGYRLEEFRQQGEITPRRLDQILSSRGINGLLLPPHTYPPDWTGFPWEKYSVVKFGRSLQDPAAHVVTSNQVGNTLLAYRKIRERGYERIGFVTDEQRAMESSTMFMAGYLFAQREHGMQENIPILDVKAHCLHTCLPEIHAWIEQHALDAVITDLPGIPQLLPETHPPERLGIAVTSILDGHADAGIDQNPREVGRVAFQVLNSLIHDGAKGIPAIPHELLVSGLWADGKSLPDRRQQG